MNVPVAQAVPVAPPMAPAGHAGLGADFHNAESDAAARGILVEAGFPAGLIKIMLESRSLYAVRYWVVDNSGSMSIGDGNRLVSAGSKTKMIACSRWEELRESLNLCGEFAATANLHTEFRVLNQPAGAQRSISIGHGDVAGEKNALHALTNTQPSGGTPLCENVSIARAFIESNAAALQAAGKKAVLVVACDGKPTDGNLATVMNTLKALPVWVVVRLCTDEDDVVEFWNGIDEQLELEMDVLDDLCGEAKEVYSVNPWINYGRPLHTAREFGIRNKLFDLLDERPFTIAEMKDFCTLIYDVDFPHPEVDWKSFEQALEAAILSGTQTWNPVTKKVAPWIDLKKLKRSFGKGCVLM